MSDSGQVFVDYTVLSPFGRLSNSAGPFSAKEAEAFINELKGHHKQFLIKAEARQAEPTAPTA
jgi:hypothetical protein